MWFEDDVSMCDVHWRLNVSNCIIRIVELIVDPFQCHMIHRNMIHEFKAALVWVRILQPFTIIETPIPTDRARVPNTIRSESGWRTCLKTRMWFRLSRSSALVVYAGTCQTHIHRRVHHVRQTVTPAAAHVCGQPSIASPPRCLAFSDFAMREPNC